MKTYIKTVHEEQYSDGSRTLGVLLNYDENHKVIDSYTYIFRKDGMYIFFNTMMDMFDYLLYAEDKMLRAYMEEADFDSLYDEPFDGTFYEVVKWV